MNDQAGNDLGGEARRETQVVRESLMDLDSDIRCARFFWRKCEHSGVGFDAMDLSGRARGLEQHCKRAGPRSEVDHDVPGLGSDLQPRQEQSTTV